MREKENGWSMRGNIDWSIFDQRLGSTDHNIFGFLSPVLVAIPTLSTGFRTQNSSESRRLNLSTAALFNNLSSYVHPNLNSWLPLPLPLPLPPFPSTLTQWYSIHLPPPLPLKLWISPSALIHRLHIVSALEFRRTRFWATHGGVIVRFYPLLCLWVLPGVIDSEHCSQWLLPGLMEFPGGRSVVGVLSRSLNPKVLCSLFPPGILPRLLFRPVYFSPRLSVWLF